MPTTIAANPTKQLPRPSGVLNFPDPLTDAEVEEIKERWLAMTGLAINPNEAWPRNYIALTSNGGEVEIIHQRPEAENAEFGPDIEIDCVHWDEVEEPEEETLAEWLYDRWKVGEPHPWEPLVHHPTEEESFVYDIPASNHDEGRSYDYNATVLPKIKRCSVNLALKIRGACKRNDLRVGQLLTDAAEFWAHVSVFELPDDKLEIYIDKIEDGRRHRGGVESAHIEDFDDVGGTCGL